MIKLHPNILKINLIQRKIKPTEQNTRVFASSKKSLKPVKQRKSFMNWLGCSLEKISNLIIKPNSGRHPEVAARLNKYKETEKLAHKFTGHQREAARLSISMFDRLLSSLNGEQRMEVARTIIKNKSQGW